MWYLYSTRGNRSSNLNVVVKGANGSVAHRSVILSRSRDSWHLGSRSNDSSDRTSYILLRRQRVGLELMIPATRQINHRGRPWDVLFFSASDKPEDTDIRSNKDKPLESAFLDMNSLPRST